MKKEAHRSAQPGASLLKPGARASHARLADGTTPPRSAPPTHLCASSAIGAAAPLCSAAFSAKLKSLTCGARQGGAAQGAIKRVCKQGRCAHG